MENINATHTQTDEFEKPRSMSKTELVQLYYPGTGKDYVNVFFQREIHASVTLMARLARMGYYKRRKLLNINMVSAIFDHLTPPVKVEITEKQKR